MKNIVCLTAILIIIGALGCKKKDDTPAPTPAPTPVTVDSGSVSLHIHTYIGENEADGYNIVYTLADGRKIALSLAQFYISGIQLVKADGSYYDVKNVILLKTLEGDSYSIGKIPVGTYKAVRFKIGLDAATNNLDASASSLLNHPEMWFSSAAQPDGYIFLNAQGKIDTTSDASATTAQMQPFSYKIGTSAHYVQVTLPDHDPAYTITKGGTEFIHMVFDYSTLFSGVQLNNIANLSVNTKADNSTALSNTIANNIPFALRYEE